MGLNCFHGTLERDEHGSHRRASGKGDGDYEELSQEEGFHEEGDWLEVNVRVQPPPLSPGAQPAPNPSSYAPATLCTYHTYKDPDIPALHSASLLRKRLFVSRLHADWLYCCISPIATPSNAVAQCSTHILMNCESSSVLLLLSSLTWYETGSAESPPVLTSPFVGPKQQHSTGNPTAYPGAPWSSTPEHPAEECRRIV
ncbi:hypothetical protein CAPTEDRAFT_188742 [Capitella teleta]|uniref:Uncharacterized protein n=1 Tax=Capitella teleta TaxID=283909 RepID=R7T6E0_CAPTE|nr:hypothetical protein CAPTEDRAFT_188742 [Capitella teleta]|eukprot:ELT89025.1 hypothetical protein CAPTEDRAFT_188742 [Capitella teleta]